MPSGVIIFAAGAAAGDETAAAESAWPLAVGTGFLAAWPLAGTFAAGPPNDRKYSRQSGDTLAGSLWYCSKSSSKNARLPVPAESMPSMVLTV